MSAVTVGGARPRRLSHHQDLVLVVLLALDTTGHALAEGSVNDLAAMSSWEALISLERALLVWREENGKTKGWQTPRGQIGLTQAGREEARLAAIRIAGGAS